MSKQRKSKLDAHAERLTEWFTPVDKGGKGYTLDQAREQLRLDGVTVSCNGLSLWWERRQSKLLQERLIMQIASGSRQVKDVEAEFARNPAPGMEAIANLHKLIAFQLAVQGAANPEMIELSTRCTKMVLDYAKVGQKNREIALNQERFEMECCQKFIEWFKDARAKEIAESSIGNADKIAALRREYFRDVDALQQSGQVKLPA